MNSVNNLNELVKINQTNTNQIYDWRFYYYLAKRKKWFLIIPVILLGLVAFYMYLSTSPIYESSTTILVSGGKLLTTSVRRVVPGISAKEDITAVKNYILSSECIAGLINTLGLVKPPGIKAQAENLRAQLPDMSLKEIEDMLFINSIRNHIKVESRGDNIIKIVVQNRDPHKAYIMTKTLAQVFIDEFQKRQLGGVRGIREFSEEQLAIFKQKLEESEERLKRYKQGFLKAQVMSDTAKTQESLRRLKADVISLDVSINDKQKTIEYLKSRLQAGVKVDQLLTENISQLRNELYNKIEELAKLLGSFDWKSPQVISVNEEINNLRDEIRTKVTNSVNSIFSEKDESSRLLIIEWFMTSLDMDILKREKLALNRIIESIQENLTQAPSHEMILANLQREVEYNRQLYLSFLKQSQGTQIEEQIQRKDVQFKLQIIELPQKPLYPVNKGFKQTLMLALLPLLGLGIGGGLIYTVDYLDQSVTKVEDIENEFNLPIWGIIPEIEEKTDEKWRHWVWQLLILVVVTGILAALIFIIKKTDLLPFF